MPWGRKSRFYSWLDSSRQHQVTAAGDATSGITFTGGGWHGVVRVRIYAVGDKDRVRITIEDHPDHQQKHCTEVYAGPLVATDVYKEKRRLRRRRALNQAKLIVKELMDKKNAPITHHTAGDDAFYIDGMGENDE